jgi:hypothetical protein
MTFWLHLSAPPIMSAGADPARDEPLMLYSDKPPPGVDPGRYHHMISVGADVARRVTRCFAGASWLRRAFPARSFVQLHMLTSNDASITVEYLLMESESDSATAPRGIHCGLRIPTSWIMEPGDALLGLRLFQAVLQALQAIGEHHNIGMPAAIGPDADRGNPPVWDPFRPPLGLPPYAEIKAGLERRAASLHPDQLLLIVKQPVSSTVYGQCQDVGEALGAVVDQYTLTAPRIKVTAWIIQKSS